MYVYWLQLKKKQHVTPKLGREAKDQVGVRKTDKVKLATHVNIFITCSMLGTS